MAEAIADNVPAKATPVDGKPPLFGLSFLENLSEMTMLRQVGLLVGLAASVAIVVPTAGLPASVRQSCRHGCQAGHGNPGRCRHSLHR
jgi:hypothetical protein